MMGNRGGRIHTPDKTLSRRRWASHHWICCVLEFRGRQREVMAPRSYTELFFLDEATAFAAGHRPCFECRRADANRFAEVFAETRLDSGSGDTAQTTRATVAEIDAVLHAERLAPDRSKRTYTSRLGDLPDGAIVRTDEGAALLHDRHLLRWSASGYGVPRAITRSAEVEVLTPRSVVEVIRAGYAPLLHPSALTLTSPKS